MKRYNVKYEIFTKDNAKTPVEETTVLSRARNYVSGSDQDTMVITRRDDTDQIVHAEDGIHFITRTDQGT